MRLYRAWDVQTPYDGQALIHAKTGEGMTDIADTFPQTDRIIPDRDNAQTRAEIGDVKEAVSMLQAMKKAATALKIKPNQRQVIIEGNTIKLDAPSVINFEYQLTGNRGADNRIILNLQYLLEAVEMYKEMNANGLSLQFYGPMRPMLVTEDNNSEVAAVIMPIREKNS